MDIVIFCDFYDPLKYVYSVIGFGKIIFYNKKVEKAKSKSYPID